MRTFESLDAREILALAISLEEEDARIYESFADALRASSPEQAAGYEKLCKEEDRHRHRLLELYQSRFGTSMPLIRRQDVKGFVSRKPIWLVRPFRPNAASREAETIEAETRRFYERAAQRASDAAIRHLLGDLAEEERLHERTAEELSTTKRMDQAGQKRLFVLQVVQPGLVGLMDGSVSTLAPLFAAAVATHQSWPTFLVGLAAGIGAGISMGFAEALSDDGSLTGRGHPWVRGGICGLMTTLGGLGHTLPYLIPNVKTATTLAITVVLVELGIIAWVRHQYMDTPWPSAIFQVVVGGLLVFLTGILIGSS